MCSSCGCGIPEEDHGHPESILFHQLEGAASAHGISINDVANNIHRMVHESHKVDRTMDPAPIKDAKTNKIAESWGEAIADAIEKGQRREPKGRFTKGKDDTHSHEFGKETVTHTHDGEKGHTHPTREYGPSFHHR